MPQTNSRLGLGDQPEWKESLKRAMPQLVHVARFGRLMANQVRYPIAATILDWNGRIISGPFRGMRFARSGKGNFAETLGTYEQCLTSVIERVIRDAPCVIIDVGAAYGYYALGLAYRCPTSRIVAYEMDPTRADLIRKYSRMNRLENRIEVRGQCTPSLLGQDLQNAPGAFVLMDVEGAEDVLLQPELPNIEYSEILVEVHESFVPGVTDRISARFAPTHDIQVIPQTTATVRKAELHPCVRLYWRQLTAQPHEQRMEWLSLSPRQRRTARAP